MFGIGEHFKHKGIRTKDVQRFHQVLSQRERDHRAGQEFRIAKPRILHTF
jgi:hypothetical protein